MHRFDVVIKTKSPNFAGVPGGVVRSPWTIYHEGIELLEGGVTAVLSDDEFEIVKGAEIIAAARKDRFDGSASDWEVWLENYRPTASDGPRTNKPDTRPWWECVFCHHRKQAKDPGDCNNCCDCGSWSVVRDPSIPPEPANVRYCNRCGHGYYAAEGRCDICGVQEFSHQPNEQTRAQAWERLPVSPVSHQNEEIQVMAKAKKTQKPDEGATAAEAAEHIRSEIARCRAEIETCQREVDSLREAWKEERAESNTYQSLQAAKEATAAKTTELLQLTNDLRRDYPLFR